MQNRMQKLLAFGLVGLVAVDGATTIVTTGNNILPTQFPVTAFPETTQTHFNSPSCTSTPEKEQELTVNYNFETVERGFPITAITPIDVYNLLNFKNINFVNTDPDFDGNHLGLAPYTYPYAAAFGAGPSLEGTLLGSGAVPMITANYSQSTLKSFTPHSWWYGCVLPSPYTAGSLPSKCVITAQGYDFNGNKVAAATQTFAFATNGSVVQDQNYATFNNGFKNIYSLAFSVDNAESAALVDNFIATVTQDACAPYYTGSYNNAA